MKKTIVSVLMLTSLFAVSSQTRLEASTCGNPSLNRPETQVWNGLSTTTIAAVDNVNCDSQNPENVASAWGTNGSVPNIKAGAIVSDEGGISYICPSFIARCVDITHTSYYRVQMESLGRQLKKMGFFGGQFAYWINLSK